MSRLRAPEPYAISETTIEGDHLTSCVFGTDKTVWARQVPGAGLEGSRRCPLRQGPDARQAGKGEARSPQPRPRVPILPTGLIPTEETLAS